VNVFYFWLFSWTDGGMCKMPIFGALLRLAILRRTLSTPPACKTCSPSKSEPFSTCRHPLNPDSHIRLCESGMKRKISSFLSNDLVSFCDSPNVKNKDLTRGSLMGDPQAFLYKWFPNIEQGRTRLYKDFLLCCNCCRKHIKKFSCLHENKTSTDKISLHF
jgi:hypothetical protein